MKIQTIMNLTELSSIEVMRHVLSASFGIVFGALVGYIYYARWLKEQNKALQRSNYKLQKRVDGWEESAEDCMPMYRVRRITKASCKYQGCWAVCRISIGNGMICYSCVKVFTDDDDEFNYNEAMELCDKLNEK